MNPVQIVEDRCAKRTKQRLPFGQADPGSLSVLRTRRIDDTTWSGAERRVPARFWPKRAERESPVRLGGRRVFHTLVD